MPGSLVPAYAPCTREAEARGQHVGDEPWTNKILCHQNQNKPHSYPLTPDLILLSPMRPPERKHPSLPFLACQGPQSCVCDSAESVWPGAFVWPPGSKPGLAWPGVRLTLQLTGRPGVTAGHPARPACHRWVCRSALATFLCHAKLGFWSLPDVSPSSLLIPHCHLPC